MLVLLAAHACGGEIEAAMPAACAVEMVHAYSLIHDDLPALDNDDLRRGRPTCHKAFDEATAILAGDGLLTLAFETLAREIRPPATAAACCAALAEAAGPCNMVGGQADDVAAESGEWRVESGEWRVERGEGTSGQWSVASGQNTDVANSESPNLQTSKPPNLQISPLSTLHSPLSTLSSIHHRKTGAMIRVSLRLGGLVAGASRENLAAFDVYGHRLGLAFQIIDDLLDVQSSEAAMGKRVGKDAQQGKLTFPGLLGLDQSTQYAQQLILEACDALIPLGVDAEGLRVLARYVLERNR